jgi:tryptophanyl-tRNA synthetase
MSKRESHVRGHAVRLNDEPEEIHAVISRAVTDSGREIVFSDAPEKAGVNNLLEIYELLTGLDRPAIEAAFADKGYGALKSEVAEVVIEALRPVRERYRMFMSDLAELDVILGKGATRAADVAEPKVQEVKRKVGFTVPPPNLTTIRR